MADDDIPQHDDMIQGSGAYVREDTKDQDIGAYVGEDVLGEDTKGQGIGAYVREDILTVDTKDQGSGAYVGEDVLTADTKGQGSGTYDHVGAYVMEDSPDWEIQIINGQVKKHYVHEHMNVGKRHA
jgi:hypothetical protein